MTFKQKANFLLYKKVKDCPDMHESERLRQQGQGLLRGCTRLEAYSKALDSTPIEQRSGFPVKLQKETVHPKDWRTTKGVKIIVRALVTRQRRRALSMHA